MHILEMFPKITEEMKLTDNNFRLFGGACAKKFTYFCQGLEKNQFRQITSVIWSVFVSPGRGGDQSDIAHYTLPSINSIHDLGTTLTSWMINFHKHLTILTILLGSNHGPHYDHLYDRANNWPTTTSVTHSTWLWRWLLKTSVTQCNSPSQVYTNLDDQLPQASNATLLPGSNRSHFITSQIIGYFVTISVTSILLVIYNLTLRQFLIDKDKGFGVPTRYELPVRVVFPSSFSLFICINAI